MTGVARDYRLQSQRQGATRLGISLSEYQAHVAVGLRWCSGHRQWCKLADFGPHSRRADGIDSQCREASREYARNRQRMIRAMEKRRALGRAS